MLPVSTAEISHRHKHSLYLQLKLADEGQKGDVNEAKLMCKWRDILRAAKTTTLRAQLKVGGSPLRKGRKSCFVLCVCFNYQFKNLLKSYFIYYVVSPLR